MRFRRGTIDGGSDRRFGKTSSATATLFETGSTAQWFGGETASSLLFGLEKISGRIAETYSNCSISRRRRGHAKSSGGLNLLYIVLVGLIGILMGYFMRKS